jgi:hypothetical protein
MHRARGSSARTRPALLGVHGDHINQGKHGHEESTINQPGPHLNDDGEEGHSAQKPQRHLPVWNAHKGRTAVPELVAWEGQNGKTEKRKNGETKSTRKRYIAGQPGRQEWKKVWGGGLTGSTQFYATEQWQAQSRDPARPHADAS